MTEKMQEMLAFFDENIAKLKAGEEELKNENRDDEAVLEKIKGNIYDVFKTVLLAAQKAKPTEEEQLTFFRNNIENIPRGWKAAYTAAEKHGDAVRLLQEKTKLDVLDSIEAKFREIWGA